MDPPQYAKDESKLADKKIAFDSDPAHNLESPDHASISSGQDVLAMQDIDPALNMKMHLVNNAIDEIGWTPYHMKLFFLNGFGYAVDSLILLVQSVVAAPAFREFGKVGYGNALTIAVYVGMLTGAIFWGSSADIIGRKFAFNVSLFICSVACIIGGAMPNWAGLGTMVAILAFGGGGNLVLDTTVFLEYLPGDKQWVLSLMAAWWGLGQAITGFIAWGFLVPDKWNCSTADDAPPCTKDANWGWRYVMFTSGALVLVMSCLRITVVRLKETPKYHLTVGDDAKVVQTLHEIAEKYNRPCSLTLNQLEACGTVRTANKANKVSGILLHVRGLFSSKKLAFSTLLIWLSWMIVGLAYPLFYVFLPTYIQARTDELKYSTFESWRNYAATNLSGIPGPIIAGFMCNWKVLGRKYTMAIGAFITMAFFFASTEVRTKSQDIAFNCVIACCLNIYYGTLYAYTPEVLPSAHRGTGNGISVALNRVMGIVSAIVNTYAAKTTSAPLYICAALLGVAGIVSMIFPYEPYGRRSS